MINIVTQYFFYQAPLNSVLLFSIALFIIGMFLHNIKRLPIKADHQDVVFVFLVSASVPLITLRFIEYAGITVWAAPIVFVLSIPVTNKGKILGLLCFDSVKATKNWREDHQEFLKILANLLADALVKVGAEKEINYMAYYDVLTGLPNRTFFKNRSYRKDYHPTG